MRTDIFLERFSAAAVMSYIRVPEVSIGDGVRLLIPVPDKQGAYVFLGDLNTFMRLFQNKQLIPRSTYLVCNDFTQNTVIPDDFNMDVNIIVLNMTVGEAMQYLNLFHLEGNDGNNDGDEVLIEFFKTIATQNITSRDVMDSWIARFPYPLKTYLACIVIKQDESIKKPLPVHEVTSVLREFFKQTNLFYYNNEFIVFYSQSERASEDLNISYDDFSALLQKYSLYAGISYVGVVPENYYTLYLTARESINLGTKIKIKPRVKRIYTFAQYHQLYLIHLCSKEFDRIHNHRKFYYMAHPDIVRIFLYDQEHGTDLLNTFYAYLINSLSLSKTAQYLYMHRNTVYNKLLKIEGILGYHLSSIQDYSNFILSYMVVKYYCDYQNSDFH